MSYRHADFEDEGRVGRGCTSQVWTSMGRAFSEESLWMSRYSSGGVMSGPGKADEEEATVSGYSAVTRHV